MLQIVRRANPLGRYAQTIHQNGIGMWDESKNRFVWIASCGVTGAWMVVDEKDFIFEDRLPYRENEWIE